MKDSPIPLFDDGLLPGLGRMLRGWAEAWNNFWFKPGSPTTLGLIRICAGILILYVHLAYSYDLFEFFGADGWMSLKRANQQRFESPWYGTSSRWVGTVPSLYLPDEREPLVDWLKEVASEPRKKQLAISELRRAPDGNPDSGVTVPGYFRSLPLGSVADLKPNRDWDLPPAPTRTQVIVFLENLPEDQAERDWLLDYIKTWGADPRQLHHIGGYYWSVWFHVTDPAWMVATHVFVCVVIFLFTIGFATRVTSVLSWLAAISYIQRSPITLFGGDTMMNLVLLYLMIAPCGAALSVDRLLARWWVVRRARQRGLPVPDWAPPQPSVSATFALRMIQINFCIIYFAAGTSKLLGGNWWNGTAIYYTLANYEFAPLRNTAFLNFLRSICQNRLLWEIVMAGGSYATLALEIGFPFLVWNRRLRPLMLACSLSLHVFIAAFMGLVAFSLLMATMVMSFIPGSALEPLLRWARQRLGMAEARPPAAETETHVAAAEDETPEAATVGAERDKGRRKKHKKGKHEHDEYENSVTEKLP
ncbi:MAG: HTTM domain-containing protein [Planctomycetia bacterium]|nr:HTTM domain-containing protein [Planctomycetia bacterium]